MKVQRIDHFVLTVSNIELSLDFYSQVLEMERITFGDNRKAVRFGNQKINFHKAGEFTGNVANNPTRGSADLCFIVDTPIAKLVELLRDKHVPIELGPIERTGPPDRYYLFISVIQI